MPASSPSFTLPRPPDPDWMPDRADREHSLEVHVLEMAIRAIVTAAAIAPAERSVIVADALATLELHAVEWCERCKSSLPEGFCYDHAQGVALADAFRRHAYRRLPGRPLIEADL